MTDKSIWFDRVYLCCEKIDLNPKKYDYAPMEGFTCYKYKSFQSAQDNVVDTMVKSNYPYQTRHTIIPVCKWMPEVFDNFYIGYKLKKYYWLGIHTFKTGYEPNPPRDGSSVVIKPINP